MRRIVAGVAAALVFQVVAGQEDISLEEYAALMESNREALGAVEAAVEAAAYQDARRSVAILRRNFQGSLPRFWSSRERADAVEIVRDGVDRLARLEEMMSRTWDVPEMPVRQATEEFRGAVCDACHDIYREGDGESGFRFREGIFALETAPVHAREWSQYLAFDDRFSINFPGEPTIHESTFVTGYGITLPARVYTAEDDFGTYSAMAVDWNGANELHEKANEACQAATGDLRGGDNPGICANNVEFDIRGATLHAAFGFLQRGSEVTFFGPATEGRIGGIRIQLLNEDGSRSFASIFWHENYLYMTEANTPPGMPPPVLFSNGMNFLDEYGIRIAYDAPYSPTFPVPSRRR